MTDERIIELLFARDEEALKEIEAKYGKLCRYIAANFLSMPEDREECINDVMLDIWNSIPPNRPRDLRAFISTAVRRQAIDKSRLNNAWKRGRNVQVVGEEFLSTFDDGSSLADDYESVRAARIVNAFLSEIGKSERTVFIMRYWLDESIGNISARTGYSEGKIKMMLLRTRRKLKEKLEKEGITV